MSASDLERAWRINAQQTLTILDAVPPEALQDAYSERTRTVGAQLQHLYYVRVRNLEQRGPEFLGSLKQFPKGHVATKRELRSALKKSGEAMAKLMRQVDESQSVKSWAGPPSTYLSYFVAHEEHHRALAIVCLRFGGHKLPQEITQGLWYEWRRKGA